MQVWEENIPNMLFEKATPNHNWPSFSQDPGCGLSSLTQEVGNGQYQDPGHRPGALTSQVNPDSPQNLSPPQAKIINNSIVGPSVHIFPSALEARVQEIPGTKAAIYLSYKLGSETSGAPLLESLSFLHRLLHVSLQKETCWINPVPQGPPRPALPLTGDCRRQVQGMRQHLLLTQEVSSTSPTLH